jgi:hypothetical protein
MGYIKEPKGIDFIIQSEPLTDKEREEISRYIAEYKARNKKKNVSNTKLNSQPNKGTTPKHP